MEGFLSQQSSGTISSWKSRFYELRNNILNSYLHQDDLSPCRSIDLTMVLFVGFGRKKKGQESTEWEETGQKMENEFFIEQVNRITILRAESGKVARAWVDCLSVFNGQNRDPKIGFGMRQAVSACCTFLNENTAMLEMIFQKVPVASESRKLYLELLVDGPNALKSQSDPICVADVLKRLLRSLPQSLLTNCLVNEFIAAADPNSVALLLQDLPIANRLLLKSLTQIMARAIKNSAEALGTYEILASNIGRCLTDTSSLDPDKVNMISFIRILVTNMEDLFGSAPEQREISRKQSSFRSLKVRMPMQGAKRKPLLSPIMRLQNSLDELEQKGNNLLQGWELHEQETAKNSELLVELLEPEASFSFEIAADEPDSPPTIPPPEVDITSLNTNAKALYHVQNFNDVLRQIKANADNSDDDLDGDELIKTTRQARGNFSILNHHEFGVLLSRLEETIYQLKNENIELQLKIQFAEMEHSKSHRQTIELIQQVKEETLLALKRVQRLLDYQNDSSGISDAFKSHANNARIMISPITSVKDGQEGLVAQRLSLSVSNLPKNNVASFSISPKSVIIRSKASDSDIFTASVAGQIVQKSNSIPFVENRPCVSNENSMPEMAFSSSNKNDLRLAERLMKEKIEADQKTWHERVSRESNIFEQQKIQALQEHKARAAEKREQEKLPILNGWLDKKAQSLFGYQSRYCFAFQFNFYYSKAQIEQKGESLSADKAIRIIPLVTVLRVESDSKSKLHFYLCVVNSAAPNGLRSIKFRSKSESDCIQWITGLKAQLARLSDTLKIGETIL